MDSSMLWDKQKFTEKLQKKKQNGRYSMDHLVLFCYKSTMFLYIIFLVCQDQKKKI